MAFGIKPPLSKLKLNNEKNKLGYYMEEDFTGDIFKDGNSDVQAVVTSPVRDRYMHKTKSFPCSECKKKFCSLSSMRAHFYYEHKTNKTFKCSACDKVFTRHHTLQIHIKRWHWCPT